jgi:tRNA dimethylallyltransferase
MRPLIVLLGATGSGKTALSLTLAERFAGEILSCDSVAVYRHMELGTAKPTAAERRMVPHHCLDLYNPDQACTAGDYARHAREALTGIASRGTLPILAGGTGLYLRALTDGLSPTPPADEDLRNRLRTRAASNSPGYLHRILNRLDQRAAGTIHPNDVPKLIRAIEISLLTRSPMTRQWTERGREALIGYRILRLGLAPARAELYDRINRRAAAMFTQGLVEETRKLQDRFGAACRPLGSLGYVEAAAVLAGELTLEQAVTKAQQGHRNYAKRQMTWFRRDAEQHPVHWLEGTGDDPEIAARAERLVRSYIG